MKKKFGAAVWGAGWVAGEHIRAYENNPHCEMVAIGSRRAESAKRAAKTAGLDFCGSCPQRLDISAKRW